MKVLYGSKEVLRIGGKTISGIQFNHVLVASNVNSSPVVTELDCSKIFVTVTLWRAGNDMILYSGNLDVIAMDSAFKKSSWIFANPSVNNDSVYIVPAGVAVAGQKLVPQEIDLGTVLNLSGNDKLIVEVTPQSGAIGSSMNSNLSYIDFEEIEAIGVESYIPMIKTNSIQANQDNFVLPIGDLVQSIKFINTNLAPASAVVGFSPIINANLTSDKLNFNDNYLQLFLKRLNQFMVRDSNLANVYGYCFDLYSKVIPLNKANLTLQLAQANVLAGKNYVVVRSVVSNPDLLRKSMAMKARHEAQNLSDVYGVRVSK